MKPAFSAPNALLLAKSISSCEYERIDMQGTTFHLKLLMLIDKCFEVDPDQRPDILDVRTFSSVIWYGHIF